MKKIKTLLFSTIPLLLGIGVQNAVMLYLVILALIFLGIATLITGNPYIDSMYALLTNIDFNTIIMIVFSVTCILVFGIWYYRSCGGNYLPNIKKTFHPLQILGIIFFVAGTQFFFNIVLIGIYLIFPDLMNAYTEMLENAGLDESISIIMIIYSVCLAPISEELIFRGVTMRIARRAFPFWAANLIQAVLFGIFHMNIVQGIYTAALGLFLGYICEKGGSIYLAILFHFLFNLWGTTVVNWINIDNDILYLVVIYVGSVVGLIGGELFFRKGNKIIANKAQ